MFTTLTTGIFALEVSALLVGLEFPQAVMLVIRNITANIIAVSLKNRFNYNRLPKAFLNSIIGKETIQQIYKVYIKKVNCFYVVNIILLC